MSDKNQQSNTSETADRLKGDEPFEIIMNKAVRLYMENGRFGKRLFSAETEKILEVESETLAAYSMSLAQSPEKLLSAVFDPILSEEIRQRALKFYNLVLQSLPAASH